jgi:hypothetical protein
MSLLLPFGYAGRSDCIVASEIVAGNADFLEEAVSGLNLTLEADATNPFVYRIGDKEYGLEADVTFAVTNNAHNFVYVDNTGALGRSALPCYYTWSAPSSPATGQPWFSLGDGKMYEWSGSAWTRVYRVYIGYVRADSSEQDARYACEPIGLDPWTRGELFGYAKLGFLDISSGTTTLNNVNYYAAVVVRGTGNIAHTANVVNQLNISAQGVIAFLGSATMNLNGLGRSGGAGGTAGGSAGTTGGYGGGGGGGGGGSTGAGGSGGGRPHVSSNATNTVASGGATGANAGAAGSASAHATTSHFRSMGSWKTNGSGGGGGGGSGSAGGNGGAGGGGATLAAACIAHGASTVLSANGSNGTAGAGSGRGGGGGGAGGVLYFISRNLFNSGTVTVSGGTGGAAGGGSSGAGGAGGAGIEVLTQI